MLSFKRPIRTLFLLLLCILCACATEETVLSEAREGELSAQILSDADAYGHTLLLRRDAL